MKIEQVLVLYLLKNKYLTLQGIGTFILDAAIPDSSDPEKPIIIPAGAISFTHNSRAIEDGGLVDFIVEQTKKIKPLASSDLDSFISLGRQFLNIGNPFNIQNMGTIQKTNSGELIFIGGQLIAPRLETLKTKIEDEGAEEHEENMFNDYQKERRSNGNKKWILLFIAIIIIGLIAWALWHYNFNTNHNNSSTLESVVPVTDSFKKNTDSLTRTSLASDSNNAIKKYSKDSYTFKVVVNQFTRREAALIRYRNLKSYNRNVIMYTNDSVTYKIAEPFNLPLSDTTRVMDSLNNYYSKGKTRIEY